MTAKNDVNMLDVQFRIPDDEKLFQISKQIALSYKATYKGLMNESYLLSLSDDHWVPILHESIDKGDTCLIAIQRGEIVGSAVFGMTIPKDGKNRAILHAIYLLPQYVGYGIGHKLYMEIETLMLDQGYNHCILEVLSSNERAVKFYSSHGYIKTNTFMVYENGMELECNCMEKYLLS